MGAPVTYHETTMPVIEHFNKLGKVAEVSIPRPTTEHPLMSP
jgi:hypothetical protein